MTRFRLILITAALVYFCLMGLALFLVPDYPLAAFIFAVLGTHSVLVAFTQRPGDPS